MGTHPFPKSLKPNQKSIGKPIMKKVCVPRLAVMAKYLSRAGVRVLLWK